jgi:glycosyltransferase involved in cell wall biosynthesis
VVRVRRGRGPVPGWGGPRPGVVILGPCRAAVSGVSTHVNVLLRSALAREFHLVHFQVGSEGRSESAARRAARLLASPFRLAWEIVCSRAAVVHINTSLDARAYWRDLAYVAVAKLCRARVVYQVHGGALPAQFFADRMRSSWLRATLAWPDVIVVLASVEAQAYRAFVPGQRVALVPNGIECDVFSACPNRSRAAAPLKLLYIGRLIATKGLFESLEAMAALRRLGVEAELVVAGEGPEEARLRSRAHELGIAERVRFVGPAFGERKLEFLRAAEVLLLPTYHPEGLPYALLEGMAAGLVPIVTRVGAIPDVALDGVHARFVPPRDARALADALRALASDRATLSRMSAASRQRVATAYSIEQVAAQFARLYSALCARRTAQAAF